MHRADLTRRSFFDRARRYALGGLAGAGVLPGLVPTRVWARQPSRPANWLTLTDEAALEPELPIIDRQPTHHHLWDRPMRWLKNVARRLTIGRAPVNATAGWRPPSWTSNRAYEG